MTAVTYTCQQRIVSKKSMYTHICTHTHTFMLTIRNLHIYTYTCQQHVVSKKSIRAWIEICVCIYLYPCQGFDFQSSPGLQLPHRRADGPSEQTGMCERKRESARVRERERVRGYPPPLTDQTSSLCETCHVLALENVLSYVWHQILERVLTSLTRMCSLRNC